MHLRRGPWEPPDRKIVEFYERLLTLLHESETFRRGAWSLISPEAAWPGNPTWQDFIAYAWQNLDRDDHVMDRGPLGFSWLRRNARLQAVKG